MGKKDTSESVASKVKRTKSVIEKAELASVAPAPEIAKKAPVKAKVGVSKRVTESKKATAKAEVKKAPVKKAPAKPKAVKKKIELTPEAIGERAYLIWEHRSQNGLPGDEASDWVEAERQLRIELA